MSSPLDGLFAGATWTCGICGKTGAPGQPPPCNCWVRCSCGWSYERGKGCRNLAGCAEARARRERALAYMGRLAQTCGCDMPGHPQEACACSGCRCHTITEDEAADAEEAEGAFTKTARSRRKAR